MGAGATSGMESVFGGHDDDIPVATVISWLKDLPCFAGLNADALTTVAGMHRAQSVTNTQIHWHIQHSLRTYARASARTLTH